VRLTNHATVMTFSRRREAAGGWETDKSDYIPVKEDVDEFCWDHFGWGGENLAKRYHYEKDQVVKDTEIYTVYQLGNTSYCYRVRETSGIPGIVIDAIWDEEEEGAP
jgi:hypothetical protein